MTYYRETGPIDQGLLDVGDDNRVYWEVRGNPAGKPAVVLHGGPGSGAGPWWARFFDPARYRVVLLDQRGCGRSVPHASDPATSLAHNTTQHLIADLEALREHLAVERWLVFGGSWGSTLGLAYAQAHPDRASELILFLVATTTSAEVRWVTYDMRRVFPEEWTRFRAGAPASAPDDALAAAYGDLLHDPDPAVRDKAARDWCAWEDAHVSVKPGRKADSRYADPVFRMAFARLVTHYWRHHGFLADGALLAGAAGLAGIPGILAHGRLDVSSPLDIAWHLARAWPDGELHVVDDAGHSTGDPGMAEVLIAATDRFATR